MSLLQLVSPCRSASDLPAPIFTHFDLERLTAVARRDLFRVLFQRVSKPLASTL